MGASTHAVTLQRRSSTKDVVLKRFTAGSEAAKVEWGRTVYATSLPVPTPEPLAFDEGAWFGAPALVLSKVAGRPELRFSEPEPSYERIAETVIAIASAPRSRLPAAVRRPQGEWEPPQGLRMTPLAERAIDSIGRTIGPARREERVMCHGDPHPGNMLWSRGRVTLIDWRSCNLRQQTCEVVYTRIELSVLCGLREGDRYLVAYERVAGERLEHVRTWDLVLGLNAMRWVPWWAFAYREQGRTDLSDELARRRVRAFVRRALDGD